LGSAPPPPLDWQQPHPSLKRTHSRLPLTPSPDPGLAASIQGAFAFLNQMMDSYAQGTTVRMCQSYSDQIAGGTFSSTAFVYDNAVLLLAYLGRGQDVQRAIVLGNALLDAQNNDPAGDGRFHQAYFAGVDNGGVYVSTGLSYFEGSAVGDVAWSGIALAQLYARTGVPAYLQGAVKAATFIDTTTKDPNHPEASSTATGRPTNPLSTTSTARRCSACWRS
jgi:hypothetical protein